MAQAVSYRCKILGYNNIFRDTISVYRDAVSFFVKVIEAEWSYIETQKRGANLQFCLKVVEELTINTKNRPLVRYPFKDEFHKFPCYLRRSAIMDALGIVNLYRANKEAYEKDKSGQPPKLRITHHVMPAFYRGNMYDMVSDDEVRLKIYHKKDWVYLTVKLREQDLKYIRKHCAGATVSSPIIERSGRNYFLRFAFTFKTELRKTSLPKRKVLAVDLGLNHYAAMSIIESDGTVTGRKFIDFPVEKDRLFHALNKLKKMQKESGSCNSKKLWKYIKRVNDDISSKVAGAIAAYASQENVDLIVFEYLSLSGKKHGGKAQLLSLWRYRSIQEMVECKAHRMGISIFRVPAAGTSALAYDGSGKVVRDSSNNSLCTFQNGKQYNADLNASYNIGARYFLHEYEKTTPAKMWSQLEAKVPSLGKRTTRVLSTLTSYFVEAGCLQPSL